MSSKPPTRTFPLSDAEAIPFSKVQAVENVQRTDELDRIVEPMKGVLSPATSPAPLKDIQAELEKALAPEIKRHVWMSKPGKEGLVVSLREMGFYDSGSATMRPSSRPWAIDRLAAMVLSRARKISASRATPTTFPSTTPTLLPIGNSPLRVHGTRPPLYPALPRRSRSPLRRGLAEYHPVDLTHSTRTAARAIAAWTS